MKPIRITFDVENDEFRLRRTEEWDEVFVVPRKGDEVSLATHAPVYGSPNRVEWVNAVVTGVRWDAPDDVVLTVKAA